MRIGHIGMIQHCGVFNNSIVGWYSNETVLNTISRQIINKPSNDQENTKPI